MVDVANSKSYAFLLDSLLIIQMLTTAQKSGNIILTYLKAFFVLQHSSENENVE